MKKINKALQHIVLATVAYKDGDIDDAAEQLNQAVSCDDLEEALDVIDEVQEACDDETNTDTANDVVEDAVQEVASLSRIKRKKLVQKAVANQVISEEDADDIDIESPEDIVEAITDGVDDDEIEEVLSDLDLIPADSDDSAVAKTALASVLRKKQRQARRNLRSVR